MFAVRNCLAVLCRPSTFLLARELKPLVSLLVAQYLHTAPIIYSVHKRTTDMREHRLSDPSRGTLDLKVGILRVFYLVNNFKIEFSSSPANDRQTGL